MQPTTNTYANQIIKHLEQILPSGQRQSQIFADFVDITIATLEAVPAHLKSMRETKALSQDTPETKALFDRLWQRYDYNLYQPKFAAAFAYLIEAASDGIQNHQYEDIIGLIYMAWGWPNTHQGQYFTPWSVASLMASITIPDGAGLVHQRLKEACWQSPLATAALLAAVVIEDPAEAQQWYIEKVVPAALPYYKPVTVSDCACGSGIMLLAAAQTFPTWMVQTGLVQFFGQDIDLDCVKMARINTMLFGLNGYAIKIAIAAQEDYASTADIQLPIPVELKPIQTPVQAPLPKANKPAQLSLFTPQIYEPALGTGSYLYTLRQPPYQESQS